MSDNVPTNVVQVVVANEELEGDSQPVEFTRVVIVPDLDEKKESPSTSAPSEQLTGWTSTDVGENVDLNWLMRQSLLDAHILSNSGSSENAEPIAENQDGLKVAAGSSAEASTGADNQSMYLCEPEELDQGCCLQDQKQDGIKELPAPSTKEPIETPETNIFIKYLGNPFYQTDKSKRIQDVLLQYVGQPETLQRGKDQLVDGLCRMFVESRDEEKRGALEETIRQLKSEPPETVNERIKWTMINLYIAEVLQKNTQCDPTIISQTAHMAETQHPEKDGGVAPMELDKGESSIENCTNQQGHKTYIAEEANMQSVSDEQKEEVQVPNDHPAEVNLPNTSVVANSASRGVSIATVQNSNELPPTSKKPKSFLQKKLTKRLLKKVSLEMNKKSSNKEKIKAGGKILLKKFLSPEEIRTGTVSGKKTPNNKEGIKYDETKVDGINKVIECLLSKPSVQTFKEFQEYLEEKRSNGLSGSDYDNFYQDVMVDYTNQLRKKLENQKSLSVIAHTDTQ